MIGKQFRLHVDGLKIIAVIAEGKFQANFAKGGLSLVVISHRLINRPSRGLVRTHVAVTDRRDRRRGKPGPVPAGRRRIARCFQGRGKRRLDLRDFIQLIFRRLLVPPQRLGPAFELGVSRIDRLLPLFLGPGHPGQGLQILHDVRFVVGNVPGRLK